MCLVATATWLKVSLTDQINALKASNEAMQEKLESLNKYIRDDLAEIASESHVREREYVRLIREHHLPHPIHTPVDHGSTTEILRSTRK